MSHASPQDVIARLPWDSSEIDDTTFLSTSDLQSYLDEAYDQLLPIMTVASGLSADSLDAATTAQMRSAECDYAVYRAMNKMQLGSGELAQRAWERWESTYKRYTSATHLLNQQSGDRTRTNAPTNGRAPQFSGRNYRGF